MEKPNIVIILADDLGWGDVGYNGGAIKTPHIDHLAKEGVILNNFYTAPICSPTRAGLMTGRYPNRFGLRETVIPPWSEFGVDTTEVFLSNMLAEAGYVHRAAFGKWHLGHSRRAYLPLQRGFTHFYGHYNGAIDYFTHRREGELDWHRDEETCYDEGYATDLITQEAVASIQQYADDSSPFFLYVAYNAPHSPLQAKEDNLLAYGYDAGKPLYGNNEELIGKGNTKRQTYSAMVAAMDHGIGEILSALEEAGIAEQTLVLFFSDNGAAPGFGGSSGELRGAKFTEWEGGVRAPAIVKWPAGFAGGRVIRQVTGYIDVVPTVRDMVGLSSSLPKPLDGMSIWSVLNGKEAAVSREFYLGYGTLIADNRWKLVKSGSGNPRMDIEEDLLFDIQKDPYEKTDLKTQYPVIYRRMLQQVTQVYDAIQPQTSVPSYETGREHFKAPKDWKVADKHPNIILIMADDLDSRQLSCYGGENLRTTHIDRLAAEGMQFNTMIASEAMCVPTRASLFTGLYPVKHGAYQNHKPVYDGLKSVGHYLNDLGYRVGLTGKDHMTRPRTIFPFDMVPGFEPNCVSPTDDYFLDSIRSYIAKNQPYCLFVMSNNPHRPWTVGDWDEFEPSELKLPPHWVDTELTRENFRRYLAEVRRLDNQVGDIMHLLKETGQDKNTIVIFLGEQGPQFPGGKWNLYDNGQKSSMIVRWPGTVEADTETDAIVQYEDVTPTLIDILGGNPIEGLDGRSFKQVLENHAATHREVAFGIHNNIPEGSAYPMRSIRGHRYKLICNLTPDSTYYIKYSMNNEKEDLDWTTWISEATHSDEARKLTERIVRRPAIEFYDLQHDPYELENLAEKQAYQGVIADYSAQLKEWMAAQGDDGAALDVPIKRNK